jgi:hypothetical protein
MERQPWQQYSELQHFVQKDIADALAKTLADDKYETSNVQVHTHNGGDSPQIPFANLQDAVSYASIRRVTLTPTQIKALSTTPQILVPQPGVRSVVIVTGITARLNYAGTAYTGANALEFRYTDASGAKITADISTTFLNSASSAFSYVSGVVTELVPVPGGTSLTAGQVVVRVPTANPGAGTSPITFDVHYRLVSFNA